jgi:hypothetical protein
MANITVTKVGDSINIDLGVYAVVVDTEKATYQKNSIFLALNAANTFISVYINNRPAWTVSWDIVAGSFCIDSVEGVAPTSNLDLFNKLAALL